MKTVVFGALAGAGLVMAVLSARDCRSEGYAQQATPHRTGAPGELIVVPVPAGDKGQLLTVIDPRLEVMSVYHIDLASGKISLRSVRNFHWDLQMTEFNGDTPLPREIRSLLQQR